MIDPILKWPGGKRWLVNSHSSLFPGVYGRYFEPFLGSAAAFFRLQPQDALLSDANAELINVYQCVQQNPSSIESRLADYQKNHSVKHYYLVRDMSPTGRLDRAARFLYLNRTCFNGMYRVNQKGIFNVPIGDKQVVSYPTGYLDLVSGLLTAVEIKSLDFEESLNQANEGDFAYIDPPYTVMHNNNGFIKYNANLFSWADQVRLATAIRRAAARGVLIMLSNADHASIAQLYEGFGVHQRLARASVLSGVPKGRRSTTEFLLTSYAHSSR